MHIIKRLIQPTASKHWRQNSQYESEQSSSHKKHTQRDLYLSIFSWVHQFLGDFRQSLLRSWDPRLNNVTLVVEVLPSWPRLLNTTM